MNKKSATAVLMMNAVAVGAMVGFAARANADDNYPGCPFRSAVVWDVCSDTPGVPGFTPGFTLQEGIPGTWGPRGNYTPIQGGYV